MKKKILVLILLLTSTSFYNFAQSTISDEKAILLLNYMQYSIFQVKQNPTQFVAEHEYDMIKNRINPTTLKDRHIIDAYVELLDNLSEIKLQDKQKKDAEALTQLERQQSLLNAMSGFNPQFFIGDPVAILLNIGFAAVNSGLNYANSISQANLNFVRENFKIENMKITKIDKMRNTLFKTSANVFQARSDSYSLINEEKMEDFVSTVNINDINTMETRLCQLRKSFLYFPPYWFALGYAQQCNKKYDEALQSYDKYENLLKNESIFQYDEMYIQLLLAKFEIYFAQEGIDSENAKSCLKQLNSQIEDANLNIQSQISYALALAYFRMKDYDTALEYLDTIIKSKDDRWDETAKVLQDIMTQEKDGGFKSLTVSMTQLPSNESENTKFDDLEIQKDEKNNSYIVIILLSVGVVLIICGLLLWFIMNKKKNNDTKGRRRQKTHFYMCTRCQAIHTGPRPPRSMKRCKGSRRYPVPCNWERQD